MWELYPYPSCLVLDCEVCKVSFPPMVQKEKDTTNNGHVHDYLRIENAECGKNCYGTIVRCQVDGCLSGWAENIKCKTNEELIGELFQKIELLEKAIHIKSN